MIEFLLALLVFVLIAVVALWLLDQLGLPQPSAKIVRAIVVLILLLVFVQRYALPYLSR